MEIDTFYGNGDMSFGMDASMSGFAGEKQYLQADGARNSEVERWYPMSDDCTTLSDTINRAKRDMQNNELEIAKPTTSRGRKRVLTDYNSAIQKRMNQLQDHFKASGCLIQEQKAIEQKQKTEEQSLMEKLKVSVSDKTGKVVLFSGILVAMGALTVLIMKRKGLI